MRKLLLIAAVVLPLVASCVEEEHGPGTRLAPWDEYGFRAIRTPRSRAATLTFASPALSDAQAEIRMLFELQSGNRDYYFVDVTQERLELGKVECGVEVRLATWPAETDVPVPFAEGRQISVIRRPGTIGVVVDQRKVIDVSDDTFQQGAAAIGAVGLAADQVPRIRVRPAGQIYAADDFMRTREEEGVWDVQTGRWAVESLKNPALSANAFVYAGHPDADEPAVALIGDAWWDDYAFDVTAKPFAGTSVGVIFRYVDKDNYYSFHHRPGTPQGTLQLIRVDGGKEHVLGEKRASLRTGQWYRLGISASGSRLAASVDGNTFFSVYDDTFAFGRAGLFVAQGEGAEFDDAFIHSERGLATDFSDGRVPWYPKGGRWLAETSDGRPVLHGIGPGSDAAVAKLIGGETGWASYRVSTHLTMGVRGEVGLIVYYRDESHYNVFTYDAVKSVFTLTEVRDGNARVVAKAPAGNAGSSVTLAAEIIGGVLHCEANGTTRLTRFVGTEEHGKAGLLVGANTVALFDSLSVGFPGEREPVLTQLNTFAAESTMANWAAAASDWQVRSTRSGEGSRLIHWHRAAFPAGAELSVAAYFDYGVNSALRLFTACDLDATTSTSDVGLVSGYELVAKPTPAGSDGGSVQLLRNGTVVATGKSAPIRGTHRITIRKVADHVIGLVDELAVVSYKDPQPVDGWRAGYAAENVQVDPEDIDVFCENTAAYSFVKAADDWRFAGGEWLVTNRWRCDPRWSFFGGESMTGVCSMWNKRKYHGDVVLEFAAGSGTERKGGSSYAKYATDMNAVICGDGSSLATGYGFMFGGWNNTKTAITRNGKIVKEVATKIPGNIHRRWFYFKIVKHGANIKYYIDNQLALEFTDPDPLPDGQVGLWTYRNGLMVARVRIASERPGVRESCTKTYPAVSPCLYKE